MSGNSVTHVADVNKWTFDAKLIVVRKGGEEEAQRCSKVGSHGLTMGMPGKAWVWSCQKPCGQVI